MKSYANGFCVDENTKEETVKAMTQSVCQGIAKKLTELVIGRELDHNTHFAVVIKVGTEKDKIVV